MPNSALLGFPNL